MREAPAEPGEAADVDPAASQRAPSWRGWPYLAIGLAAYLATLTATLPARFVVAPGERWAVAGTVWSGEAIIDGAYRIEWRWAPWRSLANFAFAADLRVTGAGTDIAGSATFAPGRLTLDGLAGTGDGGLLAAFGPPLPFVCTMPLEVRLKRAIVAGSAASMAEGEIASGAGSCTPIGGGEAAALPALVTTITPLPGGTSAIASAPAGRRRVHFLEGAIAGGRLRLAPTSAGLAAMPFAQGLMVDEAI